MYVPPNSRKRYRTSTVLLLSTSGPMRNTSLRAQRSQMGGGAPVPAEDVALLEVDVDRVAPAATAAVLDPPELQTSEAVGARVQVRCGRNAPRIHAESRRVVGLDRPGLRVGSARASELEGAPLGLRDVRGGGVPAGGPGTIFSRPLDVVGRVHGEVDAVVTPAPAARGNFPTQGSPSQALPTTCARYSPDRIALSGILSSGRRPRSCSRTLTKYSLSPGSNWLKSTMMS